MSKISEVLSTKIMKRLFSFFSKENSVRGASVILIFTLTLSNILGMFRDRFLAKNVLTSQLDVYYASFRIPDLIFNFLILGAIASAFIPVFSDYIAEKKTKEGFRLTNSLINLGLVFMITMAVILFFLMPHLMKLVVPNFDSARMAEAVHMSRLLMLTPIVFSVSYIFGGMLNSFRRFLAYAMAPLFYNLSIIIGAAFFAPKYGLTAVIISVIVGAFLHLLVQLPAVLKTGYRFQFVLDWKDSAIKRIVRLMIPRTIGMGADQILLIIYTAIASALAAGSIAAFSLANNIQTMPTVVFGTSFATAVFPVMAQSISKNDNETFAFYLNRCVRSIGFLLIPASVVFILLRAQIVRLILGSGKFTWEDTHRTAVVLGFFSASLLAQGLIPLLAKAFYALKNTRFPMFASIATLVVSTAFAFPLSHWLGVSGLALSLSIASFFDAGLLLLYLRRSYHSVWNRGVSLSYLRIFAAALVMGGAMHFSIRFFATVFDMNRFFGVLLQTSVTLLVAAIVYFGLSYIFGFEEMRWALTRKINSRTDGAKGEEWMTSEERTEGI